MIDEGDLRIDGFRSTGPNGAIDRVVRVTHLPSGITATARGGESEADDVALAVADLQRQLDAREP